jgi:anhydro-N-acetylmuramic acid kinase
LIVAGVMSGTSADGVDVALVKVSETRAPKSGKEKPGRVSGAPPSRNRFQLLGHAGHPYAKNLRAAVLAAMNASSARVGDLARLNFLLGEVYAEAVLSTQRKFRVKAELVGCHGQTLFHQGEPQNFLGRRVATTWQTGEGAVIAARLGVPVVSDFRPADMAAGGKGAPLVPFFDYLFFRDARIGRIAQNIGGIANLTAIPANASPAEVIAFDTGPGNMLIDATTERLFGTPFDREGKIAASGEVLDDVVKDLLRQRFFRKSPPKTAGREEFGREFAQSFVRRCGQTAKADVVATATALTARSIADAVRRFVIAPARQGAYREFVVGGGGVNNPTLLAMLANALTSLGLSLRLSDEFGVPSAAKEAMAFALMAYETWNRRPSNVLSATGAKRSAILGKISHA